MTAKLKQALPAYGAIAGLSTLLVVLGVLQFRWTDQIRKAELERKQAALEAGMNGFREDFRRDLAGICMSFAYPARAQTPSQEEIYASDCGDWARTSENRDLVANYYLWEKGKNSDYTFHQFDLQDESFSSADCPARLGTICDASSLTSPPPGPPGGPPAGRGGEFGFLAGRWRFYGAPLAIVRPLPQLGWRQHRAESGCPPDCSPAGYMVIELNREFFEKRFLPELVQRYFGGRNRLLYDVAIVDGASPKSIIYASQIPPAPGLLSSPDESMHLFAARRWRGPDPRESGMTEPGPAGRPPLIPPPSEFPGARRDFPGRGRTFPAAPLVADSSAATWRLVVRHPGGSLTEAMAMYWRRDLILGLGVLLVLAASMVLVLIWTQKIQRLAKMQMNFVAGVSHELRTPVSVISSAAENLADGVVESGLQVKQYGTLIRNEAQRLAAMLGQMLLFAATRNNNGHYQPRPVPVAETIDSAVADLAHLATANGFTVEKEVSPDLPPVMADPKALGRCLQNLMTNAVKYGLPGRWMAIRARAGTGSEAGKVLITVQDRGKGIEPAEIPQIFEPFYRGNAARESQTHGAGLGLSLAKEAAEAMGGTLTVTSHLGEGSAFTLHFPAAR